MSKSSEPQYGMSSYEYQQSQQPYQGAAFSAGQDLGYAPSSGGQDLGYGAQNYNPVLPVAASQPVLSNPIIVNPIMVNPAGINTASPTVAGLNDM